MAWLQTSEQAENNVGGIWETRGKSEEPNMEVWEYEVELEHHQCIENQTSCSILHCFVVLWITTCECCGIEEH